MKSIPSLLGAVLLAGAAMAAPKTTDRNPELEPYVGDVSGSVTVLFDAFGNESIDSDVAERSNVMHKARQIFTSVDVSGLPWQTSGLITSVRRTGDQLFLSYELHAVAQLSADTIAFVGEYRILGGTGRFLFEQPAPGGDFGNGTITGEATLDLSVPGRIGLSFHDHFEGTIAETDRK